MNPTVTLESYSQRIGSKPEQTLVDDIAYFARVSNPGNQKLDQNNERLIKYLLKHQHWSPFEMASAVLMIECPRDIGRQIIRHRSFSYQEYSQRYASTKANTEAREPRLQDHANRQNSIEIGFDSDDGLISWWYDVQSHLMDSAFQAYDAAIKKGIAKEQARAVLPEGLTWTMLYMSGSMRSWIHYIQLRSGPETQKEHRAVAKACAAALEPIFPMIKDFVR